MMQYLIFARVSADGAGWSVCVGTINIYSLTPGLHRIDNLSLDERYSYIAKEELGGILRQYDKR